MPKGWNIVLPSAGPLRAMLAGVGLATVAFMAAPVQALVCPIMPEQGLAGAIKEPKKEIEGLSQLFSGPEIDSRLAIEIEDLRLRNPGAGNDDLVNLLVTAYCPVVKAEALGDEAMKAKVEAFSARVIKLVYK